MGRVHLAVECIVSAVESRRTACIYPVPRCDDTVTDIGPFAKDFSSKDLDAGFWQVHDLEEESRSKTAFYVPSGKNHWMVMPMGFLNDGGTAKAV